MHTSVLPIVIVLNSVQVTHALEHKRCVSREVVGLKGIWEACTEQQLVWFSAHACTHVLINTWRIVSPHVNCPFWFVDLSCGTGFQGRCATIFSWMLKISQWLVNSSILLNWYKLVILIQREVICTVYSEPNTGNWVNQMMRILPALILLQTLCHWWPPFHYSSVVSTPLKTSTAPANFNSK